MANVTSIEEALLIQKKIFDRDFSRGPFTGVVQNLAYQKRIQFSLKFIKNSSRILDIGCGDGTVTKGVSIKAKEVIGIDISEQAIKIARKFNSTPNITYHIINVEDYYPEGDFDAAFLFESIEHLFDPEKVLHKINTLLNKEGLLLISTPNYKRLIKRIKLLFGIRHIRKLLGKDDGRIGCDHFQEYTFPQLNFLLVRAGFKIIGYEGIILWTDTVGGRLLKEVLTLQRLNFYLGSLVPAFAGHIYLAAKKK
jgi:SAM-dependent methyltransferase